MKHNLYLYASILLILTSCGWLHKDNPKPYVLPPVTQEGKGVFACFANGKLIVTYRDNDEISPNMSLEYYPPPDNGEFHFQSHADGAAHNEIYKVELAALRNATAGTYLLNDTSLFYVSLRLNNDTTAKSWIITKPTTDVAIRDTLSHVIGSLNLTRLTETNAAGTFEFKAWRTGFIDTVRVTEGRFDY